LHIDNSAPMAQVRGFICITFSYTFLNPGLLLVSAAR